MNEQVEMKKLSRGTIRLIKECIDIAKQENRQFNDRLVICEILCRQVEERFSGLALDYQLQRMGLETTLPILEAIDTFFYKYPNYLLPENAELIKDMQNTEK